VSILASRYGLKLRAERGAHAFAGQATVDRRMLAFAVPQTYMNDSGIAVGALVRRYGIEDLKHLVIVHDELDLELGSVRVKVGGGIAGHNGLRSVQAHLHSLDFVRVRIGIGKPGGRMSGTDWVLRRPGRAEREALDVSIEVAADAVELILTEGPDEAMSRLNGRA